MELIHKKTNGKDLPEITFWSQLEYACIVFPFGREKT